MTHKTVKRIVENGQARAERVERRKNYESFRGLVAEELRQTRGKLSAKRLLPLPRATGYAGSNRNFRRRVAQERTKYRRGLAIAAGRRPSVWAAGEHLVIDWGELYGLHVFCAVLAVSLLDQAVDVIATEHSITIVAPGTGEVLAEHALCAPGESSIVDEHYGRARPTTPGRQLRPRRQAETAFLALAPVAETWLRSAAASGNTRLGPGARTACRAARGTWP